MVDYPDLLVGLDKAKLGGFQSRFSSGDFHHSEHHSRDVQDVLQQFGVHMYTDSVILRSWSAPISCCTAEENESGENMREYACFR